VIQCVTVGARSGGCVIVLRDGPFAVRMAWSVAVQFMGQSRANRWPCASAATGELLCNMLRIMARNPNITLTAVTRTVKVRPA
jgi:hypothetical protein